MDKMKAGIPAALSPQEWEGPQPAMKRDDVLIYDDPPPVGGGTLGLVDSDPDEPARFVVMPEHRHALAALALHGQPFGFTWEDVDAIRSAGDNSIYGSDHIELHSIADRIAALLPPH